MIENHGTFSQVTDLGRHDVIFFCAHFFSLLPLYGYTTTLVCGCSDDTNHHVGHHQTLRGKNWNQTTRAPCHSAAVNKQPHNKDAPIKKDIAETTLSFSSRSVPLGKSQLHAWRLLSSTIDYSPRFLSFCNRHNGSTPTRNAGSSAEGEHLF